MSLLQVEHVVKRYEGLVAVDGMGLDVEAGQIVSLIGPNGAGKTTLFDCITGLTAHEEGRILLDGHDLTRLEVHERARLGLGRTFQRLEVFAGMTVLENLQVAAETTASPRLLRELFAMRTRTDQEALERAREVIVRLDLDDVADTPAGDLPTGTLRLVELGRALCTQPSVLLLDEPASGLDTSETEILEGLLHDLADEGLGILLVEHDVELVMHISDNVFVMDFGRFLAEGPPEQVREDPAVVAAYLGVEGGAP